MHILIYSDMWAEAYLNINVYVCRCRRASRRVYLQMEITMCLHEFPCRYLRQHLLNYVDMHQHTLTEIRGCLMHLFWHVCANTCTCSCSHVFMDMRVCICVHVFAYMQFHRSLYMCIRWIGACAAQYVYTGTTSSRALEHVYMLLHTSYLCWLVLTCVCTCVCTCMGWLTDTYWHIQIHTWEGVYT